MRVPQEIADAIIDVFAPGEAELRGRVFPLNSRSPSAETLGGCANTLRACALTSRAFFPRSQRHLFTAISFSTSDAHKLEALVSGSRHLVSYIEYFSIFQDGDWGVDFASVSRILGLLPNLVHLTLDFAEQWETQPAVFKNAFQEALHLPSFRSLSLGQYTFANVMELESLLSHASGLKELILHYVRFEDASVRPVDPGSQDSRVVLDSLEVTFSDILAEESIDALLSSAIDLRHLRSLDVGTWTPLRPLLKANAQTVQKVRYYDPIGEHNDPDILENNTSLRHIDIATLGPFMADSLKVFGDLRNLAVLQTVSLHFQDQLAVSDSNMSNEDWRALDRILAQAGHTLKTVDIHACTDAKGLIPPGLALVRKWLPSVAEKISVYPTST